MKQRIIILMLQKSWALSNLARLLEDNYLTRSINYEFDIKYASNIKITIDLLERYNVDFIFIDPIFKESLGDIIIKILNKLEMKVPDVITFTKYVDAAIWKPVKWQIEGLFRNWQTGEYVIELINNILKNKSQKILEGDNNVQLIQIEK